MTQQKKDLVWSERNMTNTRRVDHHGSLMYSIREERSDLVLNEKTWNETLALQKN